ncbi:outer membrane immunogenic protein [Bradyrhizobium sp. AZCC 1588]|uniref:outer membrane protein n=1 Tax=unclassified Bradyrhizobium TaxID=2631580 RepID=UPI002FF3BB7F
MKKIALAAAALAIGTVSASAADLAARPYTKAPAPIAAVYNWTGFYIGAQAGYAWGDNSTREFITATGVPTAFNQGFNTDGFVGGGHIGYNWQVGQFVFGLEGDLEGADINGGYRLANLNGTDFRLDAQASIRGRLGVAFNNSLLYVTGGAAWADMEHTYVFANTLFETHSTTRTGWTVGAGWEYGFTPNWSARLEYRYTDFGTFRNASVFSFPGFSYEHDPVFHTVRGGISYRFGGPVVARY